MRGQTATKVWPVGHLLSSHEERRQRRAKGEPLGIPDALIFRAIVGLHNGGWPPPKLAGVESPSGAGPEFSLGKPAGGRTPEPAYIQKRGCGPEAWGCCIFSAPRPTDPRGPRAPLLYGRRFRRYRTRRFSRRENRPIFWGSGETPAAFLLPFSAAGKRKWLAAKPI